MLRQQQPLDTHARTQALTSLPNVHTWYSGLHHITQHCDCGCETAGIHILGNLTERTRLGLPDLSLHILYVYVGFGFSVIQWRCVVCLESVSLQTEVIYRLFSDLIWKKKKTNYYLLDLISSEISFGTCAGVPILGHILSRSIQPLMGLLIPP